MPTANQKRIAELTQEVEHLKALVSWLQNLVQGTQECLDVAAQMNTAMILRAGGTITLTPDDYAASKGLSVQREDKGDDLVLSVGQPATSPTN